MSVLDPPTGPPPHNHAAPAMPDPEDDKKGYAAAEADAAKSDLEKGSNGSSEHNHPGQDVLLTPPTGPPFGETTGKPPSKYSFSELYKHRWAKILVDLFFVAVILGWWIGGLIIKRNDYWIQNTIISWFFLGLIFFKYVPSSIFARPIGRAWTVCVSNPFFRIPYYGRLAIGWLFLLGLVFGSAYGFDVTAGGEDRAVRTQAVFGLAVVVFLMWASSRDHKRINWQAVIVGLSLQQFLGMFVLKTVAGFDLFRWIAFAATDLLDQSAAGVSFFVGDDLESQKLFFFSTLGAIIFFIALVQLLFYIGALQFVIKKFAWLFFRMMGVSGAEAIVAVASPFIGQGESACMIKPYVAYLTPAEIHQAMTSGFSCIAGSVFLAYVNLGVDPTTLITASVMSIPASLALSKLRYPEIYEPLTSGRVVIARDNENSANALHSFSNGAWFGLRVAGLILANVLTILALLSLINGLLTYIGSFWHIEELTLEFLLGYILFPVSWLLGVTGHDQILASSQIIGVKIIANEFVAYEQLVRMYDAGTITLRTFTICSYACCGFGNIASLGIQIGVFSGLAGNQSSVIARVGPSALICGICSTFMAAAIAGMLL